MPSFAARYLCSFRFLGSSLLLAGALPLLTSCADNGSENAAAAAGSALEVPNGWNSTGTGRLLGDPQRQRSGADGKAAASGAETELTQQETLPLIVLDAQTLAAWWTQFDDAVLDELISISLQNSPSIRTALSKIQESRARRGVALSGLLPTLSGKVTGRGSETRDHKTHTTTSGETYTASLDASWEIDLFGKQQLALDAATADWEQSQENFYAAQVSLAAEVAEAYVQLRAAQWQLDVLRRNIAARAETTELTQWRAQAGDVSEMEAQQAISTLEQARAGIPSVEMTFAQARNRLALLCGMTPGSLDSLLDTVEPVPAVHADFTVGIPAETLRQRPDVRAAEKALWASMVRFRASERERLPTLTLSGSIGIEALKAGNLFSPERTAGSILGSLVAPLFEGGRITQNIAISQAQRDQALISYEQTVLTALSEVENSLIAVRQYLDRLQIVRRAAESAAMAATLASQRYQAGETDLLTVLEAQRTQLNLEEQEVSTTASLTTAHIQLYKALGGGWAAGHTPEAKDIVVIDASAATVATSASAAAADTAAGASGSSAASAGVSGSSTATDSAAVPSAAPSSAVASGSSAATSSSADTAVSPASAGSAAAATTGTATAGSASSQPADSAAAARASTASF